MNAKRFSTIVKLCNIVWQCNLPLRLFLTAGCNINECICILFCDTAGGSLNDRQWDTIAWKGYNTRYLQLNYIPLLCHRRIQLHVDPNLSSILHCPDNITLLCQLTLKVFCSWLSVPCYLFFLNAVHIF